MKPIEEWKDIPGYERLYQASSLGRIKSLSKLVRYPDDRKPRTAPEIIMKQRDNGSGRLMVGLTNAGVTKMFQVHRLILLAFVGPCPEGMEGCHNNGNHQDNAKSNLRWDTPSANQMDRVAHGTSNRGSRHGRSKLTEAQIIEIKRRLAAGEPQRPIAADYGVHQVQISKINRGLQWSHLEA